MNPSEDTFSVNNTPSVSDIEMGDVHTKDSATATVATPKQNISNPDHEVVKESVEGPNLNDNNDRREHVPEAAERIVDAAVQNFKELLQGGAKFRLEIDDGKGNKFVMSRNADPPKIEVNSSNLSQVALTIRQGITTRRCPIEDAAVQTVKELLQGGAKFRLEIDDGKGNIFIMSRNADPPKVEVNSSKLIQVALAIFAQLGPVFVANALNKSSSSSAASPSPSHSDIPGWITDAVTASFLIGLVSTLITMSLENQKSPPPKRKWTISSVAGKLALVAAASAIIVSAGAALPLGINGNLAVTGVVSLPALAAVVVA